LAAGGGVIETGLRRDSGNGCCPQGLGGGSDYAGYATCDSARHGQAVFTLLWDRFC